MGTFFHVARNTFRESLREPIFHILLSVAMALIGIFPTLALYVFREQTKLVIDSAMSTTLVLGLVAAVLCAGNTVHGEVARGTASLVLSKPVGKSTFLLAKIGGIVAALTLFVTACACASILAVRMAKDQFELDYLIMSLFYGALILAQAWGAARNFFSRKSFPESASMAMVVFVAALLGLSRFISVENAIPPFPYEMIPVLILLFFAVWMMGAITVALSTRLSLVPNLCISAAIFMAGLISDYLFGGAEWPSIKALLYALIPNWQFFWLADALTGNRRVPWSYVGWCAIYAATYMAICAICAIGMFSGKEAGESERI